MLTEKLSGFMVQNAKAIISQKYFNEEFITQNPGLVLDLVKKQAKMTFATSYLVEGAGTEAVNGVYTYRIEGEIDDCPMYELHGSDGQAYTLYRYKHSSGKRRFYISIISSSSPGTAKDVDYYCTNHSASEMTPPTEGWRVISRTPESLEPAPRVRSNPMSK